MSKLTPHEWAEKTVKDLQKRKEIREHGKMDAEMHVIENSIRIRKKMARYTKKVFGQL